MSGAAGLRGRLPGLAPAAGRLLLIGLAAVLLAVTLERTGADLPGDLRRARHPLLLAALAMYGLIQAMGAWRWKLLLDVQGIRLSFPAVLKLTLVGGFFSLLIPGAASGDVVKIAYAGRNLPGRIPAIALTIVLDRILGLSGLFLVAFLVTLVNLRTLLPLLRSQPQLGWGLAAVDLGFLGSILLYALYRLRGRLAGLWRQGPAARLGSLLPGAVVSPLRRFFQGLDLYRGRQRVLLAHLGISGCIHFCCGCCFYGLGKALRESAMTFQQYQITMQISNATGILPVTPGGLGLRDLTAATFFRIFEAAPPGVSGSIALSYSLATVLWAVAGAVVLGLSPGLRTCADP